MTGFRFRLSGSRSEEVAGALGYRVGQIRADAKSGAAGRQRLSKALPAPADPPPNPRAQLRAQLLRQILCQTFVYQFSLIAKRQPPAPADMPAPRKRKGQGERGAWRPYVSRRPRRSAPSVADAGGEYDATHSSERAALLAYYGARVESTRQSLHRRDVAASCAARMALAPSCKP